MKLNFKNCIIIGLIILIISLVAFNRNLKKQISSVDIVPKVDTVYVDKPFIPQKSYSNITMPKIITFYQKEYVPVRVDSIIHINDTILVHTSDDNVIVLHERFLTQYPESKKLVQLDISNKKLNLTQLNLDGVVQSEEYSVNTTDYNYRYVDGVLSHSKLKPKINFSTVYSIRPVENFHDLDFNISLKTGKFYYIGSLNLYYYPKFKDTPGITPKLSVQYNF